MFQNVSAKNYHENKKRLLQEKLMKDFKIFLKKKMKKSNNMVVNVTKTSQGMKNIVWVEKRIL